MPDSTADAALSSHARAPACVGRAECRAERRAATGAWTRALAFSLLAWGALLGAVFGGSAGVVTHSMAAKLAAGSLHLQRQAGTSSTTRSARSDQAQLSATPQRVAALYSTTLDDTGDAPMARGRALWSAIGGALAPNYAAAAPPLKSRYCAPPARAPPALA